MNARTIELVYFEGCPHVAEARENLRAALGSDAWVEWEMSSPETPERYRVHGSPTVLVDGRDVTGETDETETSTGLACRAAGAPSAELIRKAWAAGE